jgi:hypothetical protein
MVLKNKTNLFLKRFGSPEKSTTFAAALRVKPNTNLQFIYLLPIAIGITI